MDLSPFKNAVILDGKERKAQVTQLK